MTAYADDFTLSCAYCHPAVEKMNRQLRPVERWGEVWQVSFTSGKTKAMVISCSPAALQAVADELRYGGLSLPLQEHKILGVTVDRGLGCDHHVGVLAH